jgi:hypothetical protein
MKYIEKDVYIKKLEDLENKWKEIPEYLKDNNCPESRPFTEYDKNKEELGAGYYINKLGYQPSFEIIEYIIF